MKVSLLLMLSLSALLPCAHAEGPCDAALIRSTYNSFSSDHLDWRLATLVTRRDYEEIKHDEGASAVIYGIPVGENYDDFTKRVQEFLQSHQESLTHDQMLNILWTGLDATSGSAYRDCLNASIFASGGLHMAVIAATKTEVSVLVNWNPIGREPGTIAPKWTWNSKGTEKLPKEITQGMMTVVVPRPTQVHTLALNYPGFTSSIVIEPLSKLPDPPPPLAMVETEEHYSLANCRAARVRISARSTPFALPISQKDGQSSVNHSY